MPASHNNLVTVTQAPLHVDEIELTVITLLDMITTTCGTSQDTEAFNRLKHLFRTDAKCAAHIFKAVIETGSNMLRPLR